MKVENVMTTRVVSVPPEMPVRDVARRMLEQGISGLPVIGDGQKLLGVVSEGDLMRRVETDTERRPRSWWLSLFAGDGGDAADYVRTHGSLTRDVMTSPAISVAPDAALADVAMLLEKHRIKRVPVVDDGRVVGIVSRADLLRALAATPPPPAAPADDERIRNALVEHLDGEPWATGMVNVIVRDGIVNLWGFYDTEQQHDAYLVAARNTTGAKGVEDHLVSRATIL